MTMMRSWAGRQLAPKGRRVWVRHAVLIALVGAATQVPLVSVHADHVARRAQGDVRLYMNATVAPNTVCTGDSVHYQMTVFAELTLRTPTPSMITWDVRGVVVSAFPDDATLGTFTKPSETTEDFSDGVATADFTFKAGKKPGKTNLEFQGAVKGFDIQTGYVSTRVGIRVIDCKFSVSGALRFPADTAISPIPGPPLVAFVKPKQLTADTEGHLSGSAIIHWNNASASATIPPLQCTAKEKFGADDEVIVNGDVSDDGILTLTFEFPEATGTITTSCTGLSTPPQQFPYLVHKITVHISTKGGTIRAPATYKDTGTGGSATIVVKKLKS
jgi:hypothetical protein